MKSLGMSPKKVLQMILSLLNIILETDRIPEQWCKGLITPIYKKGDKLTPDNYRGICVANALLKILCLILNKWLQDHINEKQLINKGQLGFVPKCKTTDHLFTLKTRINKHVHDTNGKQVYACFIDFKKAYDSIWHNGLFYKLNNMEIN